MVYTAFSMSNDPSDTSKIFDNTAKKTDSELLLRAAHGDERALESLYLEYVTPIYRYIHLRTGHTETTEDLTQLVFLKFYKSITDYHEQGKPLLSYLFTIARNTVIDHYRKNSVTIEELDEYTELPETLAHDGPEQDYRELEIGELLIMLLGKLPQEQQDAVTLKYIQGLEHKDIADILGKSEEATRQILSRAIRKLREQVSTYK